MVTRMTTFDDLDGSIVESSSTLQFALDGIAYEIDLSAENERELRDFLRRYVDAAREPVPQLIGSTPQLSVVNKRAPRKRQPESTTAHNRLVREWAARNGFELSSERGRLPTQVIAAYEAAQQAAAVQTEDAESAAAEVLGPPLTVAQAIYAASHREALASTRLDGETVVVSEAGPIVDDVQARYEASRS